MCANQYCFRHTHSVLLCLVSNSAERSYVAAGDDGKVVMQRGKIALHYLRGWFIFDIISSLPYEQMIHQGDHGIPTMSIVALLKVRETLTFKLKQPLGM
jgi:hypothetical protein